MAAWLRPRERAIEMLRRRIVRTGAPRLQMTGIVLLTAGAGFLASVALLAVGVHRMAIRYPLAVILAYAAFLLLLRGWLAFQRVRARRRGRWIEHLDVPDLGISGSGRGGGGGSGPFRFGGGSSGGGGAGGTWNAAVPSGSGSTGGGGAGFDVGDAFSLDLDDLLVLVLVLIAAASALAVSVYVIFVSPTLFAELFLDGALATGLYRRLRRADTEHWMVGVTRRTWIPVVLVVTIFFLVGWGLQHIAPEARSIGAVWREVVSQ
jgi:hypothetical protein